MTTTPFQLDTLNEQNLQVIQAYALRARTHKATLENFDGWLERINELEGFDKPDLVKLHGQLIAMGFLKFEISGSSIGLRYQISTAGKLALEKALTPVVAGENDDNQFEELADAA